jgi:predicted HicB family RNase H-like nuclease
VKNKVIHCRIDDELHNEIVKAAQASGLSLTQFITAAAVEKLKALAR